MAPYTILSFNGGGIRGLMSTQILLRLLEGNPELLGLTSMFAGTSAGAAIAAQVASSLAFTQTEQDEQIAAASLMFTLRGFDKAKPAYSITSYKDAMKRTYGETTLREIHKPVVLTAMEVTPGENWKPLLFNNVLPDAPDVLVYDAVVGSGCMPGMFGAYQDSTAAHYYVDGGFVDHDPSMAAIAIAVASGVALEEIALIDIGTGLMPQSFTPEMEPETWGGEQWQAYTPLPETFPKLLVGGSYSPVLNLSLNGTFAGVTEKLARHMLGDRFVSVNPKLPGFIAENDVEGIPALLKAGNDADIGRAEALIQKYWGDAI
jgi:hypothetical protein